MISSSRLTLAFFSDSDGKIAAVGRRGDLSIPEKVPVSQCSGGVLVAGFQNSHVHFTSEEYVNASGKSAASLSSALQTMLTRFGYTTVVDTASDRDNTLALRARINSREVSGPRILTVGLPLFPPQGLPIYLSHFPQRLRDLMPQPESREAPGLKPDKRDSRELINGRKADHRPTIQLPP